MVGAICRYYCKSLWCRNCFNIKTIRKKFYIETIFLNKSYTRFTKSKIKVLLRSCLYGRMHLTHLKPQSGFCQQYFPYTQDNAVALTTEKIILLKKIMCKRGAWQCLTVRSLVTRLSYSSLTEKRLYKSMILISHLQPLLTSMSLTFSAWYYLSRYYHISVHSKLYGKQTSTRVLFFLHWSPTTAGMDQGNFFTLQCNSMQETDNDTLLKTRYIFSFLMSWALKATTKRGQPG